MAIDDYELPAEVELEHRGCPLGCRPADEEVLLGRDRLHDLPGRFRVVACRACGLMRTDPRPTPQTIGYYYPADYAPYQDTPGLRPAPTPGRVTAGPKALGEYLHNHSRRIPDLPPGRLLEVGCASGHFLHHMAARGWDVAGIEFSEEAAARVRRLGHPVFAGRLEDAPLPDAPYDIVIGWMVLEHLHDPVSALARLKTMVRPGGWLALSVPDAGALEFRIFKDAWYALHLPNHLFHFTPRTLRETLRQGGWRLEKLYHQRVLTNLVMSAGYRLQDRGGWPRLTGALLNYPDWPPARRLPLYPLAVLAGWLGQSGRMTVWARRTD